MNTKQRSVLLRVAAAAMTAVILLCNSAVGLKVSAAEITEETIAEQQAELAYAVTQGVTTLTLDQLISAESQETYTGAALTALKGVIQGPSGKESYYNLNMTQIVQRLNDMGIAGEYWVRSDGVKMFGPYVLCAANFSVHPLGTLVETSLGIGISADTGGFAYKNPTMVDIAVTW